VAAPQSVPDGTDSSPAFGPCDHGSGSHCGMRYGRYVRHGRVKGLDCNRPLQFGMSCGWTWVKTCGTHSCAPCAGRLRRRNARVVDTGMQAQSSKGKWLWLLTVTAPGSRSHNRWAPPQTYVRGAKRPECGCHDGIDLADWNPGASGCWNRLRTALGRVDDGCEFYRAAEVQDGSRSADGHGRGALHHHIVIATTVRLDVLEVQALALAAGYGCVMDLQPVELGADLSDLAAYVSKRLAGYVSKASTDRQEVPWRADVAVCALGIHETPTQRPGEPKPEPCECHEIRRMRTAPTYRTHSQSAGWGCTVKEVKLHAQQEARRRAAHLREMLEGRLSSPGEVVSDLSTAGAAQGSAGVGPPLD
jgi:hypothetical protein